MCVGGGGGGRERERENLREREREMIKLINKQQCVNNIKSSSLRFAC